MFKKLHSIIHTLYFKLRLNQVWNLSMETKKNIFTKQLNKKQHQDIQFWKRNKLLMRSSVVLTKYGFVQFSKITKGSIPIISE